MSLINETRESGLLETVALAVLALALVVTLIAGVLAEPELLLPIGLIAAAILFLMWCIVGRIQHGTR